MIIDPAQLWIFIPTALALNLTPGSDMLFCMGQGMKSGPKAGIAASLGIATGSLIHVLLGAFGLAALLAAWPVAFEVVRWTGVSYLVWLAIQALQQPAQTLSNIEINKESAIKAWRDGIVVNLLNPKVAIFILALLPQFIDASRGSTILQFLVFGAIFNLSGTIVNATVGGFSGSIGRALATNQRVANAYRWLTSILFLGLAAKLALERK